MRGSASRGGLGRRRTSSRLRSRRDSSTPRTGLRLLRSAWSLRGSWSRGGLGRRRASSRSRSRRGSSMPRAGLRLLSSGRSLSPRNWRLSSRTRLRSRSMRGSTKSLWGLRRDSWRSRSRNSSAPRAGLRREPTPRRRSSRPFDRDLERRRAGGALSSLTLCGRREFAITSAEGASLGRKRSPLPSRIFCPRVGPSRSGRGRSCFDVSRATGTSGSTSGVGRGSTTAGTAAAAVAAGALNPRPLRTTTSILMLLLITKEVTS